MKRLLVAADDAHTTAWVCQALSPLEASIFETGLGDVSARLAGDRYDLVVLDGGRSPQEHVQSIEKIAERGLDLRLVVLVEPEALEALRLPVRLPSDFLVRGAGSAELAARVRALLWPGEEVSSHEVIRVDDLTVNLATYQAYLGSEPIDFTYLEYALFAFLVTHPGRTYGREVLLRRVWGSEYYGGSRTVDVHIRRIRSKIGAELSTHLETVRNVGYLWRP